MNLDSEQENVIKEILRNSSQNYFVTGAAGTGKSTLLRHLQHILKTPVTASTGIAAVNINGVTLHSYLGVGLCQGEITQIVSRISRQRREHYKVANLIIDEISMLSAESLDKFSEIAKHVTGKNQEFGGIRIIMFGDFMQLPPVQGNFAFTSDFWKTVKTLQLTKIFRQADEKFATILNHLRLGALHDDFELLLKNTTPNKNAIMLRSTNSEVDFINDTEIEKLPGEKITYLSNDLGDTNLLSHFNCPKELVIKIGAKVMLLKNLDVSRGLCNGTCGTITEVFPDYIAVDFYGKPENIKRERFSAGTKNKEQEVVVASRYQFPLRVAYAITIHKSQGMTLDAIDVDFSRAFTMAQVYVALSRAKTISGVLIRGFSTEKIMISRSARDFYASLS
jgi:ATP-dependent DNA helicase PIF1